ncbi:hypothetical protein [Rhodoplanes sp. SY1]|uniref:hypothetical protein n=1 Tax=Rhodoplanes sp. SY1 TaxID=3166646 RepID=UPI0038B54D36
MSVTQRVDRVRAALRAETPVSPADAEWLADELDRLHREGRLTDVGTSNQLRRRDQLVIEAAASLYGGHPRRSQAAQIAGELARYQCSAWMRERGAAANPHRVGSARYFWWEVLSACPRVIGEERVRQILGNSS